MSRNLKLYIALLLLLLIGTIVIDANKPEPIDWKPTFGLKDKIPFGLYVLDHEIPQLAKNRKISKITSTPYEYLNPLYDYDTLVNTYMLKGTILSISEYPMLDEESVNELLYFAGHGNTIFLSMKTFPKKLLDSLKFQFNSEFQYKGKPKLWVANSNLGSEKTGFEEGIGNNYFSKIDTLNTTVLGYQNGSKDRVNFIKIQYIKGWFYLHTQPAVFTNFHLLKEKNYNYAQKVLSYLPEQDIYWSIKNQNGEIASSSQLRFIFSKPALRAAWYLFLAGMLAFMIFNAKRRQRIVPIKKPLQNTTVDFTKTIGNLYFQEGDHSNLIDKKIIYFLEKVRQEFMLDTTKLDTDFIKKLQQKSGKDYADVERVVYLINQHRKNHFTSIENDLIDINDAIEKIIN